MHFQSVIAMAFASVLNSLVFAAPAPEPDTPAQSSADAEIDTLNTESAAISAGIFSSAYETIVSSVLNAQGAYFSPIAAGASTSLPNLEAVPTPLSSVLASIFTVEVSIASANGLLKATGSVSTAVSTITISSSGSTATTSAATAKSTSLSSSASANPSSSSSSASAAPTGAALCLYAGILAGLVGVVIAL